MLEQSATAMPQGSVTSESSGSASYGGGLVGENSFGTISSSYAAGDVFSESSGSVSYGGGLVGYILDWNNQQQLCRWGMSPPNPAAPSPTAAGWWGIILDGTISNSYAAGAVGCMGCSNSNLGGLVGRFYDGMMISDSYWDKSMEGTGEDAACGSIGPGSTCPAASFGLTTAQMQALADTCADGTTPPGNVGTCD